MAINKVEANGETLIDLTSDTATANDVIEGKTLHLASGTVATGTYRPSDEIEARLRATVGHSSKNLLKITANTRTINGVTFTVDKQAGTVTANGTASKYTVFALVSPSSFYQERGMILSGCTGGANQTYWIDTWDGSVQIKNYSGETSISTQSWTQVRIVIMAGTSVSNLVFKPMIRDGNISDGTFEPYQEPTDSLIETKARAYLNSTVGHSSKNLLNLKNLSSVTRNGVTWTVDPVAGTITANGTATAQSQYADVRFTLPEGNYYFSGCPSGGDTSTYDVYAWDYTTNSRPKKWDGSTNVPSDFDGTKKQFQVVNNHEYGLTCRVELGVTVNNLVFKPMVWDGSIADDAFEPYVTPTDERIVDLEARVAALEAIISNR